MFVEHVVWRARGIILNLHLSKECLSVRHVQYHHPMPNSWCVFKDTPVMCAEDCNI